MGVILSPGQNPAEFILIAAKAAEGTGPAASGPGELSQEQPARNTSFDSRAYSAAAAAAMSGSVGDMEYLYEEAGRGEGEGGETEGLEGGREHAVEGGGGGEHGLLLLREEGGRTRDLLRGSRGRGTYAVGFWAQVISAVFLEGVLSLLLVSVLVLASLRLLVVR